MFPFSSGFFKITKENNRVKNHFIFFGNFEKSQRKMYAGSIGYFSANKNFDTCIALRTALIKNKKFYIQSGAGIVADSVPEKEYLETVNKAKALINSLN